jgi:hypothetical protein
MIAPVAACGSILHNPRVEFAIRHCGARSGLRQRSRAYCSGSKCRDIDFSFIGAIAARRVYMRLQFGNVGLQFGNFGL